MFSILASFRATLMIKQSNISILVGDFKFVGLKVRQHDLQMIFRVQNYYMALPNKRLGGTLKYKITVGFSYLISRTVFFVTNLDYKH